MTLELPKLLDLPAKLLKIVDEFDLYRYFLAEGGRGGGKSQAIARMCLYLGEHHHLRIVCGRETQNTIEESVYTIFRDLIQEFNLNYAVYSNKIVHRTTGTSIIFKGFREQGSVNIKGLEGVDILWIDEAQAITKNTLDIIIPTIRKQKAKVFFTMNRHLKSDPVYRAFKGREDCLHIHINFYDNPFCSQALRAEAQKCRELNPDDYEHIWEGKPRAAADNYIVTEDQLDALEETDFLGCGYHEMAMGVDLARYGDDKCVVQILQKRGPLKYQQKHIERWGKKSLMESTGRIVDIIGRFKPEAIAVDADGMPGVVDRLRELGHKNIHEFHGGWTGEGHVLKHKDYVNVKTEWYAKLAELIQLQHLGPLDRLTTESLLTVMFTHRSDGKKIIVSKEQMKSKGIKSPDEADALMMALYATRFFNKRIEETESYRTQPKPAAPGNLFKIAGFR